MSVTNLYFGWPGFLVLLAMVPMLAAAYLVIERRKKKYPVRYSSLALIRPALGKNAHLRRHIPAALYFLALTSLLLTLAHPTALVNAPTRVKTIILVMDVSDSMNDTDIAPSRLIAAELAALSFINHADQDVQIGLVAFSTNAELIAPPTTDRERLANAIISLTTGDATAIGSSILTALKAIPADPPARTLTKTAGKADAALAGSPDIIILLTDGENNIGPEPLAAADEAAARGVRVYTIGLALSYSTAMNNQPSGSLMVPDTGIGTLAMKASGAETLRQIARVTKGRYYPSDNAADLEKVFAGLVSVPARADVVEEISVVFIALGAALSCAAVVLGMLWRPL